MPRWAVVTNRAGQPAMELEGGTYSAFRFGSDPVEEFVHAKDEWWAAMIALTGRDDDHDNVIRVRPATLH